MISQNKEGPCWEGFQEHQIAWCHVSYHMPVFVQRTSDFPLFDAANWWTEVWVPLPRKRHNFSLKSALELRDQVSGGQQEPTEDQWGLVAWGSKPQKRVPMASLRSLSTGGNTESSDEAKGRGCTDSMTLRELLKTFQTKGRHRSGHFKGRTFRSSSLENLKTKAGYDYGIPGPIHVRRHIPCVFCYADSIVDNVKLTMLCQGRLQSVFCVWVFLDCQKALWNTSFLLLHEDRSYLGKVSMELLLLAHHSQWMHLLPDPPGITQLV